MLSSLHKAASFIKRKRFSFFAVFMGCFLLFHLIWIGYLVCNFNYWNQADEDLNAYSVILYLMVSPVVVAIFLGIPPYIIYEKARRKIWLYACPLIMLGIAVWHFVSRFGWNQTDELIALAVLAALYTLDIFIASRLSAPPERE
jgi:energy-converting hydrogenase Eha subunit A